MNENDSHYITNNNVLHTRMMSQLGPTKTLQSYDIPTIHLSYVSVSKIVCFIAMVTTEH